MSIQIEVIGIPRPGGSKTAGVSKSGKAFCRPANKNTSVWRSDVRDAARDQYQGPLLNKSTNLQVTYEFRFSRPKKHFKGKTGVLRDDAPFYHTQQPDLTKLVRSTEDSLTSIVWEDDALVCMSHHVKRYCFPGERPGCSILIEARK